MLRSIARPRPPPSPRSPLFFMLPPTCCPARWPSSASQLQQQLRRFCAARSLALDRMPRQHWHLHSSCTWLLTGPEVRLKKANFVSVILPCSWFSPQRAAPASTEPRAERVQQPSSRLVFAYADYDLLEPSRARATVRRSDPRTMHCLMPTAQRSATNASAFPHVLCPSTALLLWCAQLVSPGAAPARLSSSGTTR